MTSPNHGPRKGGVGPSLVVLHFTGMADAASARARLCDPAAQVSVHWLLHEDGRAELLVPEARRAWHAGAGSWRGLTDINSHSIGIEIASPGTRPFPEAQMAALEGLLRGIMDRWRIGPEAVIGHSDMAPGRKDDPGSRFDWRRLARQKLALWPEGAGDPTRPLADSLDAIGYPGCDAPARLRAFRLHFRPWGRGKESPEDRANADAAAQVFVAARG